MSSYNLLVAAPTCPHCGHADPVDIEFRFGQLELRTYHLGERIHWGERGQRSPRRPPPHGDHVGEGYVECPRCHRDYWVNIVVRGNIIARIEVDPDRPGYIC